MSFINRLASRLLLAGIVLTSTAITAEEVVSLWPNGNPDNWKAEKPEQSTERGGVVRISNVNTPTLTYYAPDAKKQTPMAIVICPGGGYGILAINKEGTDIARFFASHGYHAFVLKYRLPNKGETRYLPALQDAQRAIRLVRQQSKKREISLVGIMGFSAGGHLSAATAAHGSKQTYTATDEADALSPRPDFVGLIYPAYLLKTRTATELVPEVKLDKTPAPTFLIHALNDGIPAQNSMRYGEKLAQLNIPAELHLYARGGHGYGMTHKDKLPVGDWPQLMLTWLERQLPAPHKK